MEISEKNKNTIAKSLFWKGMENGGDQVITFLVSIVLARLLGPEKYGTLSVMLVFISISNVVIQSGFQTALIQKREVAEEDLSSVFFMGLFISALLYFLIWLIAPASADFFGDAEIAPMLRLLSVILFFGAVTSVETAIVARRMDFKAQCIATLAADMVSGAIGIVLAFRGYGTWALIWQQILKNLTLMVLLIILIGWRPEFCFDWGRLGELFSYGWKVLLSGLIDTIYNNVYTPVISKLYSPVMVGYYNRGNQFPQIIANSVGQTMQSVMLPAYSGLQDKKDELKALLRRTIKLSCFLMFPMMAGLAAVSEDLLGALLGEAWLPAASLLSLCCLSYMVWPMHVSNIQAINAQGRSDIYLKLEVIKKLLGIMVLILSAPLGITAMIGLKGVSDIICTFINGGPNARLLSYGPLKQWRDVLPELMLSIVMGLLVYLFGGFLREREVLFGLSGELKTIVSLALQVLLGAGIYMAGALMLRFESLSFLMEKLRPVNVRGM